MSQCSPVCAGGWRSCPPLTVTDDRDLRYSCTGVRKRRGGSMRTLAFRRCALMLRRKPLHGWVLRPRDPVGRGRTRRSDGDGSDPPFGRPSSGVGPCVFAHTTVPARSLPSKDPCGKAGDPMRIGTLILLGALLGAVLGNAVVARFPEPGGNPALDVTADYDPAWPSSPARPSSRQRSVTTMRRLSR